MLGIPLAGAEVCSGFVRRAVVSAMHSAFAPSIPPAFVREPALALQVAHSEGDPLPTDVEEWLEDTLEAGQVQVPVLEMVASRLLQLCLDPEGDLRHIASELALDPSLTAEVLRLANSAAFGVRSPITTIDRAVAQLGSVRIRDIALVVACKDNVFSASEFSRLMKELYRHSVATAFYARHVAAKQGMDRGTAFVCGLLHDVGWPVVLQLLDRYEREEGLELRPAVKLKAAARYHERAGLVVARRLPIAELKIALSEHHRPKAEAPPAATVALAKILAQPIASWDALTKLPEDIDELIELSEEVGLDLDFEAAKDLFEQHSSVAQVVLAFAGE